MPHYDYDKDYPFAAFITNLGKYNEGALVGEWVKFPTTAEELKKVFERIGIGAKDDFGQTYEEWFITDYDCYVDGLYDLLGEYANLDELNYLASKLDDMSQDEYERFQAAMEIGDHTGSIQELINLTENLDCYDIYPDIHDHDDLGRYYIEELDAMQVPEHLRNYIDYEAYGRDIALEESGQFTDLGYVRDTGDSFHEYYDGERGSIPEEYRVMTFQDDIPEEEISEWAMDLAYDMDEFFRQNDPQYAAEHPEKHAAKEEIYENLSDCRIASLEEKLKALGQTPEDYLPSELEKFKEAVGYEAYLDVDPQVIREAIEMPGILLRLPTLWIAGVNTWGIRLISKPAKNPTRAKRPCTIQKANGRFLRIPTKPSGRRRLPMQQGSQGSRGAALQRWEKWECFLA